MNIGIIGCGLIGKKRANNISKDDVIISCCDINEDIGNDFSEKYNCKYYQNYKDLIKYSDVDIIIISVINKFVKNIVYFALNYNKHVLIEKPMGLNYNESLKI